MFLRRRGFIMAGRPTGSGGKAEELTKEQIRRIDKWLTDTVHEHRNRALLYLGLGSGMRISEMVGLLVKDVAPNGEVLPRVVLERHSTKSGRSRTVALSRQAVTNLKRYMKEVPPRSVDHPLFPSQKHPDRPMSANWAVQLVQGIFRGAGVPNASSHSLRRTHANALRRRGVDLMVIMQQLGHATLAVTQRYFEVDPLEVQVAVDQLKF
jgi:integrase/recombinase XerD